MPLPEDEKPVDHQPPGEAIGDGGGSDKPRRPTAVGAGSPDDDFEERIADLRRYDLDALENSPVPANEIQSWPIPGLTFVRIDGILRSLDLEQEEQRRNQQSMQKDPSALPKRMYLMEDALTGLNSQKANIAYLVLGSKTGVNYYMGISLQQAPEELKENDLAKVCYEIQKSILHSVYSGVEINEKIFDASDLKALVAPLAGNVGIVSGVASLKNAGVDTLESEQIERIASGLQGLDFGMLILAAPVPSKLVSDEEFIVLDEMHKAQENNDAEKKRRIKYYLELQDAYLK